jgi:hypothetical protein
MVGRWARLGKGAWELGVGEVWLKVYRGGDGLWARAVVLKVESLGPQQYLGPR